MPRTEHFTATVLLGLASLAATPSRAPAQGDRSLSAVDRFLRSELHRQRVPGFSVAVVRDGRLVFARGYGWASLEHRVPATDSTVCQSGSLGKQFTAAVVVSVLPAKQTSQAG